MHSYSFDVHMIWLMSVLSLMPKGGIVGIKLLLPLVTTLNQATTVHTERSSVNQAVTVSTE